MGRLWYIDGSGKRRRTELGNKMEYIHFQSSAKAKTERASRNSARRAALKKGLVHKGDGQDIHHTNGVMNNSHTKVLSASANRGIREKSRLKNSKRSARRKKK